MIMKKQQEELNRLREDVDRIKTDLAKLVLISAPMPQKEITLEEIEESFLKAKKDIERMRASTLTQKQIDLRAQRLRFNEAILKKITEYIYLNPDTRFGQAISNLGLSDIPFSEESYDTYMRAFIGRR